MKALRKQRFPETLGGFHVVKNSGNLDGLSFQKKKKLFYLFTQPGIARTALPDEKWKNENGTREFPSGKTGQPFGMFQLILGILQRGVPKKCVSFTSQLKFPEFVSEWKTSVV